MNAVVKFLFGITPIETCDYNSPVTVIIPAYNEEDTIATTIKSMKEQTYPISEIIVVDDCSSDRTGEIARALGVTVIRTAKNTGSKSRAQNSVIDCVKTEYFVTIDADTTLDKHAIEKIVPAITDGKTLSACGFVIPQVIQTFWERARFVEYTYGLSLMKAAQAHLRIPLVSSGCFSIFNKKLFDKAGRFPEGNIAEDMALTWKAHLMGYQIKYVPDALCYPKDPSNWVQYRGQVMRWYRGFFQCIKDYKFNLFARKRLIFFISFYTVVGLLAIVFLVTSVFLIPSLTLPFLGLCIADFLLGFAFTLHRGIKIGMGKLIIKNYILLLLVTPLNAGMFIYAFWKECVVNEKLVTWDKGH